MSGFPGCCCGGCASLTPVRIAVEVSYSLGVLVNSRGYNNSTLAAEGESGYQKEVFSYSWKVDLGNATFKTVTALFTRQYGRKLPFTIITNELTTSEDGLCWRQNYDDATGVATTYINPALWNGAHVYIGNSLCFFGSPAPFDAGGLSIGTSKMWGQAHQAAQVINTTRTTQQVNYPDAFQGTVGTYTKTLSLLVTLADVMAEAQQLLDAFEIDLDNPQSYPVVTYRVGANGYIAANVNYSSKKLGLVDEDWTGEDTVCFIAAGPAPVGVGTSHGGFPALNISGYVFTERDPELVNGTLVYGTTQAFSDYYHFIAPDSTSAPGSADKSQGAVAVCMRSAGGFLIEVQLRKTFLTGPGTVGSIYFFPQESYSNPEPGNYFYRTCGLFASFLSLQTLPAPICLDAGPISFGAEGLLVEPGGTLGLTFVPCFGFPNAGCPNPC